MYVRGTRMVVAVCGAGAAVLVLTGAIIIGVWTHQKVEYDSTLFVAFVVVAFITCCWQIGMVVIAATNSHQRFSWAYLASAAAAVAIAGLVARPTGMLGCVAALGAAEVAMLILSQRTVARIVGRK